MLITFEGIDGSGKTTQAQRLLEYFRQHGINAVLYREPGSTPVAEQIRSVLLTTTMHPLTELLLFEACRHELTQVIKNDLKAGKIVILDRYILSTFAYQGFGKGLSLETIGFLNKLVGAIKPDITFILDIPVRVALQRKAQSTRFENRKLLEKARQGFLALAKHYQAIIIDATKPPDAVFSEILATLKLSGISIPQPQ